MTTHFFTVNWTTETNKTSFKYISKVLTCMIFFLYKQKMLFIKETDTFGHMGVWTIYTSHIDHFTPQHTAFEQSLICLSVFQSYFLVWYRLQYCDTLCELQKKKTVEIRLQYLEVYKIISVRKIYIYIFCLWTFQGQIEKMWIIPEIHNNWAKILWNIAVRLLQGGASFVDYFCHLCFVFVMISFLRKRGH